MKLKRVLNFVNLNGSEYITNKLCKYTYLQI